MTAELKRRDLDKWPDTAQLNAAAMALQLWGGMDPDGSRYLARYVVRAVQRAGVRPTDGLPTEAEIHRAEHALARRQIYLDRDAIYAALLDALCPSLEGSDELPSHVDSDCGICQLEGPDRFGNYDLIPDPRCRIH